jgi:hypothetical protein
MGDHVHPLSEPPHKELFRTMLCIIALDHWSHLNEYGVDFLT